MRIAVLGAGIAGIVTAWYLAAAGAEVVVLDREAEPAAETSHANGGHISTASAAPWTGPEGVREFAATRLRRGRAVRILPARDPGRWRWFAAALAASRPRRYRQATATLRRLAAYSREQFDGLVAEQRLALALECSGSIAVYRSRAAFARARRRGARADAEVLERAEVLALEPALGAARVAPAGGFYYRGDATGDCKRFCIELAARAKGKGAEFRFGTQVRGLVTEGGALRAIDTDAGALDAEACVIALGADTAVFLRRYGVRVPVLPLRGYTLSAPIAPAAPAPGRLVDVERRVVFARLGGVFRAAGMADFAGASRAAPAGRTRLLTRISRDWYPELRNPEYWSCLRPMTPDGPPLLGAAGIDGVWLNVGMGPLGWTLGCGAGRIVADLVLGRRPDIALDGLAPERFL